MASAVAKLAAGTFVPDAAPCLPSVLAWLTEECRRGILAMAVKKFCEAQVEMVEPALVLVDSITADCIHCRIPCRCSDHESAGTFDFDVRFVLDPRSGVCRRV